MSLVKLAVGDLYQTVEIARHMVTSQPTTTYSFILNSQFELVLQKDVAKAMEIYWHEVLLRSHLCAISGLKRFVDWIDAIERSNNNYIMYCSSLRGLMECAGDTYHGLHQIAITLAENSKDIRSALSGTMSTITIGKELEDLLIHFSHASKKLAKRIGETTVHPKLSKEYVKLLENGSDIKFYNYYQSLCEIVHPASDSLGYNFDGDDTGILRWNGKRDSEVILKSIDENRELIKELILRGINPILLLMKTINLFEVTEIQFPAADKIDLRSIPAWSRVLNATKR